MQNIEEVAKRTSVFSLIKKMILMWHMD